MQKIITVNPDVVRSIFIDANLYPLEIIESSTIPLSPFGSFKISLSNQKFKIEIKLATDTDITMEDLCHSLENNIIHESLRLKIAEKTELERNLILSYTFSNTKLMG
ncbi:hypothetical protein [Psychromonas aquatilis]|uniref:His-Xaa-Ser system protein HxsD n=1 Tax=Psychromonas aquatilis TaxID=2005072 RepID=A0ABU9GTS1_9GAMM